MCALYHVMCRYRFASVVAQRLKTLGALTKGDRRAAGGGDTSADGIDSFAIEGDVSASSLSLVLFVIFPLFFYCSSFHCTHVAHSLPRLEVCVVYVEARREPP
jgi:hypothetical protein